LIEDTVYNQTKHANNEWKSS